MFEKLKEKWKVSWFQFGLILTTFALGGSLCARLGKYFLGMVISDESVVYWIVYIPFISLLWPLCVLAVSIPLGQYSFFINYLKKIGQKLNLWSKDK